MLFSGVIKFFLHLNSTELSDALVEEIELGIADKCELLENINNRRVFNQMYKKEIEEIYSDDYLLRDLVERIQPRKCSR